MVEKSELKSWDDVDLCLAELAEKQRAIELIEAGMQEGIDNLKLAADMQADPEKKRIGYLEKQILLYTDAHMDDLDGKKTKVLTFGKLGYRKSTKVKLPKAAAKLAEIIRALRNKGMTDCIVTSPEKIDKEALKKYAANDITAVGAGLDVQDVFWYEPDRAKLAE
jgi:phage host-nuclease inhibitor protein Gam